MSDSDLSANHQSANHQPANGQPANHQPATGASTGPLPATKLALWAVWLFYVGFLLLSDLPPGPSLLHTPPATVQTVIALSLNFWFVLPTIAPPIAPVVHPALEGLFNLLIAWALLFWGFLIDRRHQRVPMLPFLIGTALLTNVFYLAWLALRQPNSQPPTEPLNRLEAVSESRGLPGFLTAIALISILWASLARPEFGDLPTRWQALLNLITHDRLTFSFIADLLVFWLFQAWLIKDDMARRNWQHPPTYWIVRLLPFIGLVIYLVRRPALPLDRLLDPATAADHSR